MVNVLDVTLDGVQYMLQSGGNSIATIQNPSGLRSAGGELLREFDQWTTDEWDSFSRGIGQLAIDQGGYLHTDGDTLHGGFRLRPVVQSASLNHTFPVTDPFRGPCGAYFARYGSTLFMGMGNKLITVQRNASTGAPEKVQDVVFRVSTAGQDFPGSWLPDDLLPDEATVVADPYFPLTGFDDAALKADFCIVGMVMFGPNVALAVRNNALGSARDSEPLTDQPFTALAPNVENVSILLVSMDHPIASGDEGVLKFCIGRCSHFAIEITPDTVLGPTTGERERNLHRYSQAQGLCVYNGRLWFWTDRRVYYTAGTVDDEQADALFAANPNPTPGEEPTHGWCAYWMWASARLPVCAETGLSNWRRYEADPAGAEHITGIVSLQGQTLGEDIVYVSTNRRLYSFLSGDVFSFLTEWGSNYWWNGLGAIECSGDAYFPVGNGLIRVTPTGQIVEVGLDQMPVMPEQFYKRHSCALISIKGMVVSMVEVEPVSGQPFRTRLVGRRGDGWHPVATLAWGTPPASDYAALRSQGVYFDSVNQDLWWVMAWPDSWHKAGSSNPNTGSALFVQTFSEPRAGVQTTYTNSATLILPPFDAGAPMLDKDWNQLALYGKCFDRAASFSVHYRYVGSVVEEINCDDSMPYLSPSDPAWSLLATKNPAGKSFIAFDFPQCRTASSRAIQFKIVMTATGSTPTASPVLTNIRLQHYDYIKDYNRFSLSLLLPFDCMRDVCGEIVPGYVQENYDALLLASICKSVPIEFVDVDGKVYMVRIDSASRRTSNIGGSPVDGTKSYDITWSLVLTQLLPETVCASLSPCP